MGTKKQGQYKIGALDSIHEAHRSLVAAMCDYESYRGSAEAGKLMDRHRANAISMAKDAIEMLQDFIAIAEGR